MVVQCVPGRWRKLYAVEAAVQAAVEVAQVCPATHMNACIVFFC